ncbi:MAG TPA: phosphoribosylanthranilate isomerase [Candidatus Thermoplasmatota archaeon]|nr:phosphoribosylanthranilate isomerase [Candidatus Thermoplasmatota archaeon]
MALHVKICGLTRPIDVAAALEADYLGFVIESPQSRRNLATPMAAELVSLAAPGQHTVAVTASTDAAALDRAVERIAPDALQLPARIPPAALRLLRASHADLKLFLACRPDSLPQDLSLADALVLDALSPDGYGGTGHTLPWAEVREAVLKAPVPVFLAGGLTPGNVAEAVRAARPFAVDVSSGVESGGLKDPEKIQSFIRNARLAGGVASP